MSEVKLLSVQVATPQTYGTADAADPHDRTWTTSFYKKQVAGPVRMHTSHVTGDEPTDAKHHGGEEKAALAYAASHYPLWENELSISDMPYGGFGENLTLGGCDEATVCIGDVWRIGDVVFQVSQPRQPCWKLSRRWRTHDMVQRVQRNNRSGWYFRVLQEGSLIAGAPCELVERTLPKWTIVRANEAMYHHKRDLALAKELANLPLLSSAWREHFQQRAERLGKGEQVEEDG